jgi:hypothetical protein
MCEKSQRRTTRTKTVKLSAALFLLLLGSNISSAADAMKPNDIKTMFFDGQPFTAATTSGTKFKMTFTPDGKTLREPIGSSVPAKVRYLEARCCRLLY